ncbi:MAG: hypothetical protein ACXVCP_03290 [Bdellovibrio sp.]
MLVIFFFSELVLATVIPPAESDAFNTRGLYLQQLCNNRGSSCSNDNRRELEKFQLTCQLENKSAECNMFEKSNPEQSQFMRHCDLDSLCKENTEYLDKYISECWESYKQVNGEWVDAVKEGSLTLSEYINKSWQKFKNNVLNKDEYLKECDKSIACKRDLVKGDPGFEKISDEKLNQLPANFLYKRAQKVQSIIADAQAKKSSLFTVKNGEIVLNAEDKEKLQRLMNVSEDKLKETYSKYMCYTPLARQKLKCYALGGVVDPVAAVGFLLKTAKFGKGISQVLKAKKEERRASKIAAAEKSVERITDEAQVTKEVVSNRKTSVLQNRKKLINKYLNYSPTTEAENLRWISMAEDGKKTNSIFLDVENSQIKSLNDTLKDKNLVTSVTNFHKELLNKKLKALAKEFPEMQMERYSDFKSMRFAINGKVPKDLEAKLQNIFSETNDEFDKFLKEKGIVRKEDATKEWFRAGTGKSADQANLTARFSRQLSENKVQNFANIKKVLSKKLDSIERDRKNLRSSFAKTSVIDGSTLHVDAFDIVRKANGDKNKISKEIAHRFGLSHVPEKTVETLQRYVKEADEFSPGLYIAKREYANLNDAVHGGLSADIIGLGGANLKGTAEALAKRTTVEKVIQSTRLAEKQVTKNFLEQKKTFEKIVEKAAPGKFKTTCSGDDCVSIAIAPLSELDKKKILAGLSETKYSGAYRIAFVPHGVVEAESRNILATHGEGVEKVLRKSLSSKMEPNRLKGLTFGVDMQGQNLNSGGIKLLIGKSRDLNLSSSEKELIQKKFQEAVKYLNQEIGEQSGIPAEYIPLK